MTMISRLTRLAAVATATLAPVAALAHHPTGGETPATFVNGFLSGIGHPVIGIDHLAFVVAAGAVAALAGQKLWLPLVFVAASMIGVLIHVQAVDLPVVEIVIALSVLAAGALLASGREVAVGGWAGLFALAGLFHGHAYGEAVYGAGAMPVVAYLLGLALVQSAIAIGVMLLLRHRAAVASAVEPRLAGAFAVGVGLSALAGNIFG